MVDACKAWTGKTAQRHHLLDRFVKLVTDRQHEIFRSLDHKKWNTLDSCAVFGRSEDLLIHVTNMIVMNHPSFLRSLFTAAFIDASIVPALLLN